MEPNNLLIDKEKKKRKREKDIIIRTVDLFLTKPISGIKERKIYVFLVLDVNSHKPF